MLKVDILKENKNFKKVKEKINKISNYIYTNKIILIFSCIILFSICTFPNLNFISMSLEICTAVISILILIIYIVNGEYSEFIIVLLAYFCILFISTAFNKDASLYKLFLVYYKSIAVIMYIELLSKKNIKGLVNSMCYAYTLIVIINFFTIILFRDGLYKTKIYEANWFIGYKNVQIFTFFPCILFSILYKEINNIKYKNYFLIINFIVILISLCFLKSANSIVAFTIFLVYFLTKKYINKFKCFNIITYCSLSIFTFFTIVIYRIQNLFSWLIVDILHKDLTFTNRTLIWDKILKLIEDKPILGYGLEEPQTIGKKLGNRAFTHAHNTILDVIYQCGIIGFMLFMTVLYFPLKQLYIYRDNKIVKTISVIFFCIFVMMNFEARQSKIGLYILLSISYNIKDIINFIENNKLLGRKENENEQS